MTEFAGIFEVLASDQSDARLASRKALVLSRDRIDARLGKFLSASRSPQEFDARYELVADDFAGIVRVAADEVGHEDPDSLVETLRDHYREAKDHWIQDAVKKPGDLHKKLDVPEGEKIPEDKIENAEETGDKDLKEKAQFAENVKGLGKKKKGKKDKKKDKDGKPPWLEQDDDDSDDEGDDSLEFAAKTAGAVPFVRIAEGEVCHRCGGSGETGVEGDGEECKACHGTGKENDRESSLHIADGKGNTGLAGPSPKMDKKRWTPKSVKPIDVPSERHPTVQKDITEVMPKDNEGPPGDAHNIDEIWSLTTTEELPTGTGMDAAGFAGNNQDMAPHTKTFGDGGQTDPVKSESLEA
jgi:hypothetical protein